MRPHRLLNGERGSAPVESIFAIVMLVVLTMGTLQVAFSLYARNVTVSAAHEGARAIVERGAVAGDAEAVATEVVRRAAGGLVDDLAVDVTSEQSGSRTILSVHVRGKTARFGPVPVTIPLRATATAAQEVP